ncbi:MAG: hypothetical protein JWM11_713 [Planctomycetaceae bacterium]|nr:hypothetical protein [Planctomycetaceae bacterium]
MSVEELFELIVLAGQSAHHRREVGGGVVPQK